MTAGLEPLALQQPVFREARSAQKAALSPVTSGFAGILAYPEAGGGTN